MCLNLLGLCDAIHIGHLLVSQHKSVAHIAAGLCHVSVVHVHSNEPIRCLVTLFAKLALHDGSQGNQVKHDIVNKQNYGFAATIIVLFLFRVDTATKRRTVIVLLIFLLLQIRLVLVRLSRIWLLIVFRAKWRYHHCILAILLTCLLLFDVLHPLATILVLVLFFIFLHVRTVAAVSLEKHYISLVHNVLVRLSLTVKHRLEAYLWAGRTQLVFLVTVRACFCLV